LTNDNKFSRHPRNKRLHHHKRIMLLHMLSNIQRMIFLYLILTYTWIFNIFTKLTIE